MSLSVDVLFLSSLPLHHGGIETHLRLLLPRLQPHLTVAVASGATQSFQKTLEELKIPWFPWQAFSFYDIKAIHRLRNLLRQIQPHLLHVQDARAAFLTRVLLPVPKPKLIYTVHLPPYLYAFSGKQRHLRRRIYTLAEALLNRCCTYRVVYVAQRIYQDALRRKLVPPHRAVLLPNGIDLTAFMHLKTHAQHDPPRCCIVARLTEEKGVDLALQALAQAVQHTPWDVWIFGDGPLRPELEVMVHMLGLQNQVRFWGSVPSVTLYRMLSHCSTFLLLSRYEGGRTYALMEAQAVGLPAVVSAVGDHPDMVKDGVTGFVVPKGDVDAAAHALVWLAQHPEERVRMSQAARRQSRLYDIRYQVQGFLRLYSDAGIPLRRA